MDTNVERGEGIIAQKGMRAAFDRLGGGGHVRLAEDRMIRVSMVLGVGKLPREVRDQQRAMEAKADRVIDDASLSERAMATLMTKDPQSSGYRSSGQRVPHMHKHERDS